MFNEKFIACPDDPDAIGLKTIAIGGFQKQSLIDYPGNISSIIFTCGCNFRCNYCHNPELVLPGEIAKLKHNSIAAILDWITKYRKLLNAVVITGGEPTMHARLPVLIHFIKNLGLKVKLDSNGTNYEMLKHLINKQLVDFVAMDIKAPLSLDKYRMIVGGHLNTDMMNNIKATAVLLMEGNTDYEFRTTLDPLLTVSDIKTIINSLRGNYYLQRVQPDHKTLKEITGKFNEDDIKTLLKIRYDYVNVMVR